MDLIGHLSHLITDQPVTALIVVAAPGYAGWDSRKNNRIGFPGDAT